jgi:hypothetical protein
MCRDSDPCLDRLAVGLRAARFLDSYARNLLLAPDIDPVPFAGRPGSKQDIGAAAVLQGEAHQFALAIFDDLAATVEDRDQGDRKPR